jgi:arabinose-5-phosphate isomerase
MDFRKIAQEVIKIESDGVLKQLDHLGPEFHNACELLLQCKGRIVVIGLGKSGHIGSKIAATLASTGSPAFSVHPTEAMHGDLGMVTAQDVILAISYSGKTPEILSLAPSIKKIGAKLISMTGDLKSPLARLADISLCTGVDREACPLGLAPTASTTSTLVMGDALAIALLEARGFTKEQFALSHPGGNLGKRLLLKVSDFMHQDQDIPRVSAQATFSDALIEMTSKRLGVTTISDANLILLGIFTDGDVRRTLQKEGHAMKTPITQLMNTQPKFVAPDDLASKAFDIMETYKITSLVVLDSQRKICGIIHLHDLLQGGL